LPGGSRGLGDVYKRQTLALINELEQETGRPVVTSNQASMWGTLRSIGDTRDMADAGRLFKQA
jgi:maleate isomerase